MYRMHANCPDGIFERFQIALHDVNRGDMQAFHAFHRLYLNGYGAADFVRFLKPIANKMTDYASVCKEVLYHSHDIEAVKYALMLLSLTKVPESMKEDIKLFMEVEDFTYFALLAFKTFGHVNQEIMAFIKNDDSIYHEKRDYGIRLLDVKTAEEREWLMYECPYSSSCEGKIFVESGAYSLLKNHTPLTEKQFHAIGSMLNTYYEFGVSSIIVSFDNYADLVAFYIEEAKRMTLTLRDVKNLVEVKEAIERDDPKMYQEKFQPFFESKMIRDAVEDALDHARGYGAAIKLHIPYEEKMAQSISSDWDKYFFKGRRFYINHPEALDAIMPIVKKEAFENNDFYPFIIVSMGLGYRPGFYEDVVQKALTSGDENAADYAKSVLHHWERRRKGDRSRCFTPDD